jgi:zinc protease
VNRFTLSAVAIALLLLSLGCPKQSVDTAPPTPETGIPDARPELPASDAYVPPIAAIVQAAPFGETRLLERPALDLVSIRVVIPYGSAADPKGKAGLADLTAEMMEQGAGEMDAFELALAAERLGADISVYSSRDLAVASVDVVASKIEPALDLLADVLLRPRFEESEWERTHALWLEDLQARAFDPARLAGVVGDAALFGRHHPYGHPSDGWVETVETITLDDVRAFHATAWRPDTATLAVAGRITADALAASVARAFGDVALPPIETEMPPTPTAPESGWPRLVIVDRPDSPQTVLRITWPGPTAADERTALDMVDFVLGGSFTSRLMANLREDKGYTYGARSRLPFRRGAGPFYAGASVQSEVTGKALVELLGELSRMAEAGVQEFEVVKAKASLRNEDVEVYERVSGTAGRLGTLAGLGLPVDFDAKVAAHRTTLDAAALSAEAVFFAPDGALVVAVGDAGLIVEQLAAEGIDLGDPELRDPEGKVVQ